MWADLVSSKQEENYPVVELLVPDEPWTFCLSITSMMLVFAEAYETEAYYFDEEGHIRSDYNNIFDIEEKYGTAYFIN